MLLVLLVALLLCKTHKKEHTQTLFFSRSLSLCSLRVLSLCKGSLSREMRVLFLKGKMRKSGSTNLPPLCVEYTLRALVKGRRSARAKAASSSTRPHRGFLGRIKEFAFSLFPRDFTKEQKKRNRESAQRSLRSGLIEKRI